MLLNKARKTVNSLGMFVPGEKIVAGVSGGADSMALLCVLRELGANVVVSHFNHRLRGDESSADAEHVRKATERYGLVFEYAEADTEAFRKKEGLSTEDAARKLRYDFFNDVVKKHSAARVATGHTLNDQAETVIMRLLRGSGSLGLSGIRPSRGDVIRPLINVTRDEVKEYLRSRGVEWREDSTNISDRFLRNRIRNELVPLLETYNPDTQRVLSRLATVCSVESDFIRSEAARRFESVVSSGPGCFFGKAADLASQPDALRLSIMRKAVSDLKGNLLGISSKHIFAAEELLKSSGPATSIDLPGGIVFCRGHGVFLFARAEGFFSPVSAQVEGPGRFNTSGDMEIEVAFTDDISFWGSRDTGYFPPEKVSFPISARSFRDGDRFVPLGMRKSKKLKDFFIDEKIPKFVRRKIPIFETRDGIIWIGGLRQDERFRADRTKGPWLRIRVSGVFRELVGLAGADQSPS